MEKHTTRPFLQRYCHTSKQENITNLHNEHCSSFSSSWKPASSPSLILQSAWCQPTNGNQLQNSRALISFLVDIVSVDSAIGYISQHYQKARSASDYPSPRSGTFASEKARPSKTISRSHFHFKDPLTKLLSTSNFFTRWFQPIWENVKANLEIFPNLQVKMKKKYFSNPVMTRALFPQFRLKVSVYPTPRTKPGASCEHIVGGFKLRTQPRWIYENPKNLSK